LALAFLENVGDIMTAIANPDDALITQETVTAYRDLRRGIGLLGLTLPWVLIIGHHGFRESISGFYYTNMRNWFVGSMCVTGVFLIFYRYQKAGLDNVLSSVAGVCAILVALCPTTGTNPTSAEQVVGVLHLCFAACFLGLLAYFCLFLFTKTNPNLPRTPRKNIRNRIYTGCGISIIVGLAFAVLCQIPALHSFRDSANGVYWGESLAVVAFGIAWLIKGETLFRDPPASSSGPLQAGAVAP